MSSPAPNLLIVDDTPDNIAVLFDFLVEQGFNVLVCESGAAALDTLAVEEPDLILLDVMMPGMDGMETCRRIKATPAGRDVPVFFMTALGEPYDKVRGLEAGAVDYLTKPVFPEEVLARIRTHLEISRLQKELQEKNDRLDAALQRSIVAERALEHSLNRALILVDRANHRIDYATFQARQLIDRLGGADAVVAALTRGAKTMPSTHGETVELNPQDYATDDHTVLVTLQVRRPDPSPDDLKPLGLTPREREILFWISQGKTNPEVATILGMQVCTVKKHVENFLPKLGVETRLAAALRAQELLNSR
ncbi:MAG TPA: response regulator [Opitutus sp.]|nr:response regulator [Opitutus sp.]